MKEQLQALRQRGRAQLAAVQSPEELEQLRVALLGKKGELTAVLRQMGALSASERPAIGQLANDIRQEFEAAIERGQKHFAEAAAQQAIAQERIDVSLPGRGPEPGAAHPLMQVMERVCQIFQAQGYALELGPEVEDEQHNFTALNFPANHPARDMQDTIYVAGGPVLRTHTTPVQIRVMERMKPPIKAIFPGKVFRHDDDVTHSPVFHQVDGLAVDEEITFADLKGTIEGFVTAMFGEGVKVRFRPSFFPFTEPSAEVDIGCIFCRGQGCRVCKGSGWLEIMGAGLVDPNVFAAVGVDAERYSGFAFGLGVERVAMLLYGVNDIRYFYQNDLRFLEQF